MPIGAATTTPATLAPQAFSSALYGSHPYARYATEASVSALQPAHVAKVEELIAEAPDDVDGDVDDLVNDGGVDSGGEHLGVGVSADLSDVDLSVLLADLGHLDVLVDLSLDDSLVGHVDDGVSVVEFRVVLRVAQVGADEERLVERVWLHLIDGLLLDGASHARPADRCSDRGDS